MVHGRLERREDEIQCTNPNQVSQTRITDGERL